MKIPTCIASRFTKFVVAIAAMTATGSLVAAISSDKMLFYLSVGIAIIGGIKIADYYRVMRQYGVDVPIRTQGWITDKLASVTVANGRCVSLQYLKTKGGQGSQRFFSCMNELIQKAAVEKENV